MDIFCCRISNSITSLLVICLILMAVGPSQSEKIKDCVKKIHEVFRVFTATNNYENDLTKLFKYAILNLRYVKPEEKQGYILYTQNYGSNSQEGSKLRLLYDGNRLQGDVCNNELAYAYYKTLANIYEKGRTVLSGTTYCDGLPDAEKIPCKNALEHFGFTAEDEESIIKFAFTKIVLYDIRSNVTFIDNPTMLGECVKKIYALFKTDNPRETDVSKLIKYAIVNLRLATTEERQGLVYNAKIENENERYFMNSYSYNYFDKLVDIIPYDEIAVPFPQNFCQGLTGNDRKDALDYFGFFQTTEQGIIQYAYWKITFDDITSGKPFRHNMPKPKQSHYAGSFLQEIANAINIDQNEEWTPQAFCARVEELLANS